MLITDPKRLQAFYTGQRIWQGIPSVEVTKKGRIFVTFYSGGTKEEIGNYAMVVASDDGGMTYSEPIAAAYLEGHRCYDPCLWLDPLGRLWFTWSICPNDGLYASVCDDPDAETLRWGEPFFVGNDIMMNKPIVLSSGEWLFPLAVWDEGIRSLPPEFDSRTPEKGSFVYKSSDNGKTFHKLGGADVKRRHFDEHMVVELLDGRLMMLVRTFYGIGMSFSDDRGKTWSKSRNSLLGGPSSRFHIRRLASGRLLLINHVKFTGRNNLTALLSEDDGKTWPHQLLLDGRKQVSYPDAAQADDGSILITYDRDRGAFKKDLNTALACQREILMARITEEDILAGTLVSEGSYLQRIVSKLGAYEGPEKNPYNELGRLPDGELAHLLLAESAGPEIITRVFDAHPLPCSEGKSYAGMDEKIALFEETGSADAALLEEIITMAREASRPGQDAHPTVQRVKDYIREHLAEELQIAELAKELGISRFYLHHLFKQECAVTILEYRNELRLTEAKKRLISTDDPVGRIAGDCGFGDSSYFAKVFAASEGVTPTEYRKMHTRGTP